MMTGKGRRCSEAEPSSERGQATVELALVLPVVVLFALLVVQVGIVAKDLVLVTHAAREAARAAAVDPTAGSARTAAVAGANLDSSRMSVSLKGGTAEGDRITATVTYRSATAVPLIGRLVPDVTITESVTMRVE